MRSRRTTRLISRVANYPYPYPYALHDGTGNDVPNSRPHNYGCGADTQYSPSLPPALEPS